jgi:polar amino acid transport system substrate-binding protein
VHSAPPAAIAELAPLGRLRVAINFGNSVLAQRDPASGAPAGLTPALAHELAGRLGVPLEMIPFDAAGKVFAALKAGAIDVAFLAAEPERAAEIAFTPPYVLIEGTYLVPAASPWQRVEEVDRTGVRIAVAAGSAYALHLGRTLRQATLVAAPSGPEALALFLRETLEAAGGVRQSLADFAARHPGLRVMEDAFMAIRQAIGTPRERRAGAAYLAGFIEELKANGFVAEALRRSGQSPALAAPPAPA